MPYISLNAGVPVSKEQKETLQKEIGRLISIIPGKNIDNCMTKIEGGCDMYMSGEQKKAAFCEIRLLGAAPHEKKCELYQALLALFTEVLGIETLYLNYIIFTEWGSGNTYRKLDDEPIKEDL